MRKLLLFVGTFVAMVLTLCAQEQPAISTTEYVELIVAPKAENFSFEAVTTELNPVIIDWGDGSVVETVKPTFKGYQNRLKHTFKAVSDEKRTIKIDATSLVKLIVPYAQKNCVGIGTFVAPKLEEFSVGMFNNFKDSETDFSHCPELKSLTLSNLGKKAVLCPMPKLLHLDIMSDLVKNKVVSCAQWEKFDLNNYPALETLDLSMQEIDELIVPEAGMPALKSLVYTSNYTIKAINLKPLTQSKTLTCVNLFGNLLSPDQLPQQNPEVTYKKDYGDGYKVNQIIAYISPTATINGNEIDMSFLNTIPRQFGGGDPVKTQIKWYYYDEESFANGNMVAVPANAYKIENGVTKFNDAAFKNGAKKITVLAEIRNALFPQLSYEDDEALLYTNDLTLSNTPPTSKGTLKFQKEYEGGNIKMEVLAKNGDYYERLAPEAQVPVGTELLLAAGVEKGSYTLKSFSVSYKKGETPATETLDLTDADKGKDGYYSKAFTSVEGDMEITLNYGNKNLADYELTITQPEHGVIELKDKDGKNIEAVEGVYKVKEGDLVRVRVSANKDYKVQSVTIGETVYNKANGNLELNEKGGTEIEYTVAGNAAISAVLEAATASYAVTYSFPDEVAGKVTATVDGAAYESGKPVEAGKKVLFTYARGDSKWAVESWTVDGKAVEGTKDKDTFELTVEKDAAVGMTLYNHAEQIAGDQIDVRLINNGTILEVSGIAEGTQVSLYDAAGRELLTTTEHRINVTALAEGVYMVRALDQVVKVVK